jgi:hypothetical protein
MFLAKNNNIIDGVFTTLNILGTRSNALRVVGGAKFDNNITIGGTLNANNLLITGTTSTLITNAVNVGTGDVIYKGLSGSNLQFKTVSHSPYINITTTSNTLAFDVSNLVKNHISSTSNPHNVTASQVSSTTTDKISLTTVQGAINTLSALVGSSFTTFFEAYNNVAQTISTSYTDIVYNLTNQNNAIYTFTLGTSEITFTTTGKYLVQVKNTFDMTTGTVQTGMISKLILNAGAGYNDVGGSINSSYLRTTGVGYATTYTSHIVNISTGHKIKVQALTTNGSPTVVQTVNSGCNIVIQRVA